MLASELTQREEHERETLFGVEMAALLRSAGLEWRVNGDGRMPFEHKQKLAALLKELGYGA